MTKYGLFVILLLAVAACKGGGKQEAASGEGLEEWKDFTTFYERFHQDSAYQMAHIIFPL